MGISLIKKVLYELIATLINILSQTRFLSCTLNPSFDMWQIKFNMTLFLQVHLKWTMNYKLLVQSLIRYQACYCTWHDLFILQNKSTTYTFSRQKVPWICSLFFSNIFPSACFCCRSVQLYLMSAQAELFEDTKLFGHITITFFFLIKYFSFILTHKK